ncbi:MAG: DivIVA domain-containing protein, partial [Acidimicrobiales bacterium]
MPDPKLDVIARVLGPDDVASRAFPATRRGLDPEAVRRFVEEVAATLRIRLAREDDLARRLEEAERRAATPVLDEETLAAAVGAETAKVLRAAHDAAREVVARAEARSAEMLADAGS